MDAELRPRATAPRPPPVPGWRAWLRANLFANRWQAALTLAGAAFLAVVLDALLGWALWGARFTGGPRDCEAASGACWAFVAEHWGLFLVGTYPAAERWRPAACLAIIIAVALVLRARPPRSAAGATVLGLAAILSALALLRGGPVIGLAPVDTAAWGGLMLTLLLSIVAIALSLPIGIALALARRSRTLPAARVLASAYVELMRSVPLVSVLFLAAVLVPLFLPGGISVDNLLRAQVGIVMFQSAYMAEVVRGGLQAVPAGQDDAARALGLDRAQTTRLVILPQALRAVVPALVNQVIIIVKDTSLVVVIGMFDLLGIAEVTVRNQAWLGRTFEAYAFVGAIYWTICFTISRLSRRLEAR